MRSLPIVKKRNLSVNFFHTGVNCESINLHAKVAGTSCAQWCFWWCECDSVRLVISFHTQVFAVSYFGLEERRLACDLSGVRRGRGATHFLSHYAITFASDRFQSVAIKNVNTTARVLDQP